MLQERFYGNGRCRRARLRCRRFKLIQATFRKDSDKASLRDGGVGQKPRQQTYPRTRAHRVVGYEHVAGADVPRDADRLLIDRPVVEIRAGQDATMVRKLCHRLRCFGALEIISRGSLSSKRPSWRLSRSPSSRWPNRIVRSNLSAGPISTASKPVVA
jgi:hypothetical protein